MILNKNTVIKNRSEKKEYNDTDPEKVRIRRAIEEHHERKELNELFGLDYGVKK